MIDSAQPLILVIGLGNPILGDDGVGWAIAQDIKNRLSLGLSTSLVQSKLDSVEVDFLSLGGLSLMERLVGCQYVILIDAIVTGTAPLGTVRLLRLDDLPEQQAGHLASAHDVSLKTALRVGQSMGYTLPNEIWVIAIESHITYEFSEKLSAPVEAAIPEACDQAFRLIHCWIPLPPDANKSKIG
jgi:hydrogenase maturation protease